MHMCEMYVLTDSNARQKPCVCFSMLNLQDALACECNGSRHPVQPRRMKYEGEYLSESCA